MDHHRIDSDKASLLKDMKPVLIPDGTVPYDKLELLFTERGMNIEHELYTLVRRKLSENRGAVDAGSFSDRGLYLVTRRLPCQRGNTLDPIRT